MSGTPTISERYSVLTGPPGTAPASRFDLRVSLVLLSRGARPLRPQAVEEALGWGFLEVLWVDGPAPAADPVALVDRHRGLTVLRLPGASTPGARINAAAREARGDRFLVLWDDQRLPEAGLHTRVQRLWADSDRLALVPELRDRTGRELPSVRVPGLERDRLKILSLGADEETVDTLFPPDFTALYHRQRFLLSGGFDPQLTNPFWQKLDWGLRCRLWGEALAVDRGFKVEYRGAPPLEDQTPDRSYPRFYWRNLAVRHAGDHGVLPLGRFWPQAPSSGLSLSAAWAEFRRARNWVRTHRYRFQADARLVTELWGTR